MKKEQGCQLGKPENLMRNLDRAIANSRKTNQEKALNNANNKRAVAILRGLVNKTSNMSEMARILNAEGFLTSRGGSFSTKQVSLLLQRYNITSIISKT